MRGCEREFVLLNTGAASDSASFANTDHRIKKICKEYAGCVAPDARRAVSGGVYTVEGGGPIVCPHGRDG